MKKTLFCTVISVAYLMQSVYGLIIDFEDLYPGFEAQNIPVPSGYAGFNWSDDVKCMTYQFMSWSGYRHGTVGAVSVYTNWSNNISITGTSFDFLGAYITSAWNINHDFTVEGWRSGQLIYSSTDITSYDGPYWFDFEFYDIDTLWFKPGTNGINAGLGAWGNQLCIDNITLVPEPCTLMLLGLGGFLIRKR